MALLCCTKKLRDKLPGKGEVAETKEVESGEDDWYGNLFRLGRRQAVIFTHAESLYSFIIDKIGKKHGGQILVLFRAGLEQRLKRDGFSQRQIKKVLEGVEDMRIGASRSRSVLGSMNDMVNSARYMFYYYQGEYEDIIEEIMVRINRTPMSAIDYKYPVEKFGQYCLEKGERKSTS